MYTGPDFIRIDPIIILIIITLIILVIILMVIIIIILIILVMGQFREADIGLAHRGSLSWHQLLPDQQLYYGETD